MNPLKNQLSQNQMLNSPFDPLVQFVNSGGNPKQLINQMIYNNPQAKQAINAIEQKYKGKTAKQIAVQMANERGIDLNQINQVARMFGQKL